MTERENILGRIKEALSVKTAGPGHGESRPALAGGAAPVVSGARQWLPPVGDSPEDKLSLFRRNAGDLKAGFVAVASEEELQQKLRELQAAEGWKKIAAHGGALTSLAIDALALPVCRTDGGYDVKELEACDAAVTECDALVAQTGSVLVTSMSAGGRGLSVLPPHHVVLARRAQLLGDLPEAFALLKQKYGAGYPSFISFITGPSRTGDIERILVLGAHGPKKLTIFLL